MNKLLPVLAAACLLMASAASGAGVSEAKLAPLGSVVTFDGVITQVGDGECYVESGNRSAGIWVVGEVRYRRIGEPVRVTGTRDVAAGEACVIDSIVTSAGSYYTLRAFSLNNRAIGGSMPGLSIHDYLGVGSSCRSWTKAGGASNTGLLVKTWGTVKSVYYSPTTGARWFYVDDGSNLVSDHGDTGLLVYSDVAVKADDFVAVTGISSVERSFDSPDRLIRVLRARDAVDVVTLKARTAPEYPFSDEFGGSVLDPRWYVYPGDGSLSLSSRPGYLTLTAPRQANASTWAVSPQPIQKLYGDCDIDMKVHVDLSYGERPVHRFKIMLKKLASSPELPTSDWVQLAATETGYTGTQYTSSVMLGSSKKVALNRDTCYFRIKRRAGVVYTNVSFDGANYLSADVPVTTSFGYLGFNTKSSSDTSGQFSAYVDYFRYTSVP